MPLITQLLGVPRTGKKRELKKALESYWSGKSSIEQLQDTAKALRRQNWEMQKAAGIDLIPSNDFSLYDHMLDMCTLLGVVPARFGRPETAVDLQTYFAMARGTTGDGGVSPLEMTKWFDTNYHYIVPELAENQEFNIKSTKAFDEFREALGYGIKTKPVLVGPITFLLLSKGVRPTRESNLEHLDDLLPIYIGVIKYLHSLGAEWIQFDEPALVGDVSPEVLAAFEKAYRQICAAADVKIMLATYFGGLGPAVKAVVQSPVNAVHFDLVRAPQELPAIIEQIPNSMMVSAGIVDGRNVWRSDLQQKLEQLKPLHERLGQRLILAPSCSLLHVPITVSQEKEMQSEVKMWLAFAQEKMQELRTLAVAMDDRLAVDEELRSNQDILASRRGSPLNVVPDVRERLSQVSQADFDRKSSYPKRAKAQHTAYKLPVYPTTTIGSLPQTREVRVERTRWKKGEISSEVYQAYLKDEIAKAIKFQEENGIDVLVHGEFERTDMVEYFAEQLRGFLSTEHGWVQSYGSRYVKPPIIFGDVFRPSEMTVSWAKFAQSLTKKPVKGMLTGPVTLLQWSFVRDDQPRSLTCRQIAVAIRDEVLDLEKAGITMIQIDEPALREGLPLRARDQEEYLQWAVQCFRLSMAAVADETQIHTHMCYSEFNEIMESIAALDADVISIEASRSNMELLDGFQDFKYPNEVGPGIWDIHSPRVPSTEEMTKLLKRAAAVVPPERLWVNPDCGLKTRGWDEVAPGIKNMVSAALKMRELKTPCAG